MHRPRIPARCMRYPGFPPGQSGPRGGEVPGMTREQFHRFALPLAQSSAIHSYAWVPRVPAAQKTLYELEARRQGLAGFTIFQNSATGRHVPPSHGGFLFPLY